MSFTALLQLLHGLARRKRSPRPRPGFTPRLDPLEERTVPSNFIVLNNLDSGAGSLRQAILDTNTNPGPDTITFAGTVHHITLTSGELKITDNLNIQGPGANKLDISGNNSSRVFSIVGPDTDAYLTGLTITRGLADRLAPTLASAGGGVLNLGNLTLTGVVVSDNKAVGNPSVTVSVDPVFNSVGGAFGGGVANFGQLNVNGCTFTGNQAVGADNADSTGFSFPGPAFPGNALGGGLANFSTASVTDSQFTFNTARAGSGDKGDFASIGGGGAILNDADMTITGSAFSHNQALGGSNSVSLSHDGHALGGAIMTGSLKPFAGLSGATLLVSQSSFDHNQAIGGNDNQVTLPLVAKADGPNNGYGGAILVYQGSATLSQSTVEHNQAIGGAGGAAQNGSLGVGGGIFFFNFVGGVTADVSNCTISHNDAIGGSGSNGGRGGDGLGGGIAIGSLGAPFGGPGTTTISNTTIDHNVAQGGEGGKGGNGGDGLGGGLYNDARSTLTVSGSLITENQAKAGKVKAGGTDGQGIGGGVYNLDVFTADVFTVIQKNHASTSNDDLFP